jgi:hypothetical protein
MSEKEHNNLKILIDSMLAYWIILLLLSLGAASIIYAIWLKDVLI